MIYTLTLNPALDRTIIVDNFLTDDANRIKSEVRYAGGKGINVSRVIEELGGHSTALGFVGGFNGIELEGRLINDGIICDFIKCSEETRTNIYIHNRGNGKRTALNAKGPAIRPIEIGLLHEKIMKLSPKPTCVVISGSLPPKVNDRIYAQLIRMLKNEGIKVALDSDGNPFQHGIEEAPFAIKPNAHELARLVGRKVRSGNEIVRVAKRLHHKGIENVIVTRGPKGLICACAEGVFKAVPPDVKVNSTTGAGDSTLGAFVFYHLNGYSKEECIKWACAAGTASTLTPGSELCKLKDVKRIYKKVAIEKISQ